MSDPALLSFRCHIEGRTLLNLCHPIDKLSTLGQDDIIIEWASFDLTQRLKQIQIPSIEDLQADSTQYTSFAYEYCESEYFLGTSNGKIIRLKPIEDGKYAATVIYDAEAFITTLSVTQNNSYLVIGSYGNSSAVLLELSSIRQSTSSPKVLSGDKGHDGAVLSMLVSRNEKYVGTLGNDGYAIFYQINQDFLKYCCKFKVMEKNTEATSMLQQGLSENPSQNGLIAVGGSTILQQIWLSGDIPQYKIKSEIQETQAINGLAWINQFCLGVAVPSYISIWNYKKCERIVKLSQLTDVCQMVTDPKRIFCTKIDGIVYVYQGQDTFNKILKQSDGQEDDDQMMQIQQNNEEEKSEKRELSLRKNKKKHEEPKLSIAAQLIKIYPQRALESSYEGYMQNRFLYYNQYGCIIQRTDGDSLLIELQYHDKQKIHRIKFQQKNKSVFNFALTQNSFAYSTLNHFHFNRQVQTIASTKTKKQFIVEKWDYKWDGVEGIVIGTSWVAVASKLQIKIFDFSGNQLHSICYCKDFICMAAYEDILVLVYHSSIPFFTTQLYEMKVYNMTLEKYKLSRSVKIPVKDGQTIKWFGFSQEGILFVQQSSEDIRMYHWVKNQWMDVYQGNPSEHKVYIQHIQNYQIFGFLIEQKSGEPCCPTVQPRSTPKRIPMSACLDNTEFLTQQENNRVRWLYFRKNIQELEKFRIQKWYKYKYCRSPTHQYYSRSSRIMSSQDLELAQSQHDVQIIEYTKKIVKLLEENQEKIRGEFKLQNAKMRLYLIASKLLHYEPSLVKLKQILGGRDTYEGEFLGFGVKNVSKHSVASKYKNMERIMRMVDLGSSWRVDDD